MDWGHPEYLIYLWLAPMTILIGYVAAHRRQARLSAWANPKNLEKLAPPKQTRRAMTRVFAQALAAALIVIALAEPRWGFEWQEVKRKGVDIMVALDVSQSMKAQDISPSRLGRAKREIIDLMRMLKGDRLGLIAFAGVGFVQCPLTTDYKAVEMFLSHLEEDLIPIQGTSLNDAIKLGVKSLSTSSELASAGKAIILITDGEDQDSSPLDEARKAKEADIKIFTIGMGKEDGAPIPLASGGFKKDSRGNLVITKLSDTMLKQIAETTGGRYVRSTSGDLDLKSIYENGIKGGSLKEGEISQSRQKLWYERGPFFAAAAMLVLLGV